jgi:cobalt/nickel transport system permease protein
MWYTPVALHIPDGFLSTPLAILGWMFALIMIGIAIRQTGVQLGERQIPLMGVLAAFVFAAQAINFPVAAGTSGHLLGGALIAIVMGPWAATLIMTAVISVQGLIFQDGGLLAMGWNILNMGVLTAFTGFAAYEITRRLLSGNRGSRLAGAFFGAWMSVEIGAIATALELAVSNTSPLRLALPAMVGVHALIGLGEAIITTGAISLLQISRPEVLTVGEMVPGRRAAALVTGGLLVALGLAIFSPWASSAPDGLEFVAESKGFLDLGLDPLYELLPDYTIPFIPNEILTTILAVGLGTLIVFIVALAVGKTTVRHQTEGK